MIFTETFLDTTETQFASKIKDRREDLRDTEDFGLGGNACRDLLDERRVEGGGKANWRWICHTAVSVSVQTCRRGAERITVSHVLLKTGPLD